MLIPFVFLFASLSAAQGFLSPAVLPGSPFLRSSARSQPQLPSTAMYMSLKPAAAPLMDSGKALARSGELIIELTQAMDLYGGGLSAAGAQIRNAGDSIAQAAASCRFKTGLELVVDELREAGTCFSEAVSKLELAAQEAKVDELSDLSEAIGKISIFPIVAACCSAISHVWSYFLHRWYGSTCERLRSELGGCRGVCYAADALG